MAMADDMRMDRDLIVVVGPTASGKSTLAIDLARALDGEIIGADSVQIYRYFDVGSGKPSPNELARVPHHLIGIIDPLEPMDAGRYVALADRAIADVRARGRRPIVCGGSFLWVKALLYGLAQAPPADPAIRARHAAEAQEHGRVALHARLEQIDSAAARRLAPNDLVRVSRALEVWELTGRTLSDWQAEHGFRSVRHPATLVGVRWSPEDLAKRIAERVRVFLDAGWIDEVRDLIARGYREARAMASVGYRQVAEHVAGRIAEPDLPAAVEQATRLFARRQRTWLRDAKVTWVEGRFAFSDSAEQRAAAIQRLVGSALTMPTG